MQLEGGKPLPSMTWLIEEVTKSDEITVFHMRNIIICTRLSYILTLQNIADTSKNYDFFKINDEILLIIFL